MTINELMINYALTNNLKGVVKMLHQGANINYNDEQLLQVSVYLGNIKITKLCLRLGACKNIDKLIDTATELGHTKLVALMQQKRLAL